MFQEILQYVDSLGKRYVVQRVSPNLFIITYIIFILLSFSKCLRRHPETGKHGFIFCSVAPEGGKRR